MTFSILTADQRALLDRALRAEKGGIPANHLMAYSERERELIRLWDWGMAYQRDRQRGDKATKRLAAWYALLALAFCAVPGMAIEHGFWGIEIMASAIGILILLGPRGR